MNMTTESPRVFSDGSFEVFSKPDGSQHLKIDLSRMDVRMLANRDTLLVKTGWAVQPGDTMEVQGITVKVVKRTANWGEWNLHFNLVLDIEGDQIDELRERMTFRVERLETIP